ncbi:MAG: transcriptional regulator [Pseudomonadota bacterium]|nr:transcriptional regulator [Pseudomonadota bacterium]
MKRAVIQIRSDADEIAAIGAMGQRFVDAWNGAAKAADAPFILTFSSASQLFSVLSPKRWELIEGLQGLGASSIRGLARTLGRDVKRVHEDVSTLMDWGLVEKDEEGRVVVPFEEIEADFILKGAAA